MCGLRLGARGARGEGVPLALLAEGPHNSRNIIYKY